MNFRPELAEAVMRGEKTITRRLVSDNPRSPWFKDRCAYRVGQSVAVCPGRGKHAIGKARVVSVERVRLGLLSDDDKRSEGFSEGTDFYEAWREINGHYDPNALVWRIGLEPSGERERVSDE